MNDEIYSSSMPPRLEESRQQIKVTMTWCWQYLVLGPLARGVRAIEVRVPCMKEVLGGNQVIASPEISAAITNLGHVFMEHGEWSTAEDNEEIASTAAAGIPHRLIAIQSY